MTHTTSEQKQFSLAVEALVLRIPAQVATTAVCKSSLLNEASVTQGV